ncbi:MAG: hypothetical protein WCA23_15725 [Stellaceae bacterium]
MAETVALTLEQIAAQNEAADRDRQRQLEWAVVIQRQLDSGRAGDATLVPREGDRERQVERVMTSYEDGSFLIDRLAAGWLSIRIARSHVKQCCRFPVPPATRQAQPPSDYYRLLTRWHTLRPSR